MSLGADPRVENTGKAEGEFRRRIRRWKPRRYLGVEGSAIWGAVELCRVFRSRAGKESGNLWPPGSSWLWQKVVHRVPS